MNPEERISLMRERLLKAFSPSHLEIQDDSAKHQGHAGAQGGASHYTLFIQSEHFKNKTRVAVHQEIYAVLKDLMPHEIHALSIMANTQVRHANHD